MRQWDSNGNLIDAFTLTGSNPSDGKTPGNGDVNALHSGFNDTNWDRWRNNTKGTLLASAARTATTTGPIQTNYNARGVQIVLNISAASGTGGLQLIIQGFDPVSSTAVTLNVTAAAVIATGLTVYELYPGITGTGANVTQRTSGVLPRTWRISVLHGDATSYTYSVGYSQIL